MIEQNRKPLAEELSDLIIDLDEAGMATTPTLRRAVAVERMKRSEDAESLEEKE